MSEPRIPTFVLGGSGYVGAEVMRLLWAHPILELRGAFASGQAGTEVGALFPHLHGVLSDQVFRPIADADRALADAGPVVSLFSCLPHGATAETLDRLLTGAQSRGQTLHLLDLSADFRHRSAARYEEIYGQTHPAPTRLEEFTCGLPELSPGRPAGPVAHPGCFATCVTLGLAPVVAARLVDGPVRVSAVTGSTGSGRQPKPGTHHPDRHGSMRAYKPLAHRHRPEIETMLGGLGESRPEVLFVPTSGPFARGIYATTHFDLRSDMSTEALKNCYDDFYADSPFVSTSLGPPSLKEVVGTNRCRVSVAVDGRHAVAISAIDNLVKGAAGGAVQWMNRLIGQPDEAGLDGPGWGWN